MFKNFWLAAMLGFAAFSPARASQTYYIPAVDPTVEGSADLFDDGVTRQQAYKLAGVCEYNKLSQADREICNGRGQGDAKTPRDNVGEVATDFTKVAMDHAAHTHLIASYDPNMVYRGTQLPVAINPNEFHYIDYGLSAHEPLPDFSVYQWSILTGAIVAFLLIDFLANLLKPIPFTHRWRSTACVAGVAGAGFASLQHAYDWEQASGQFKIMLSEHPLASGVGAIAPVLVVSLVLWGFARWRALKSVRTSVISEAEEPRATEEFYRQAGIELRDGSCDPALWARALVEGNGDDGKTRAAYVKLRVADLQRKPS